MADGAPIVREDRLAADPEVLEKMFYPKSVAVVGASSSPMNMGRNIVQNLQTWGYGGAVYPVNPRGEEVLGLEAYTSISEVPRPIDLAVAFVPARAVPSIIEECAAAGIRSLAIPSGGFSELGVEGEKLAGTVAEAARRHGIRFVGPNGLTIINSENGLCLPFLPMRRRERGSVSIISQSGGVGLSLIMFLDNVCSSFDKFISVGNKLDMDEIDFLEYLGRDPGTRVICMFLESVVRGERFIEVASELNKPLIIYKANTTEVGARTAASHTAALANNDDVVEGAFQQSGVLRVNKIKNLVKMSMAFNLPPMKGNRIAIVSPAGGYAVLAADEAYKRGFEFPPLGDAVLEELKDFVRSNVITLGNPLDLGDVHSSDAVVRALDAIMAQDYIDGVVAVLMRRSDAKYDGAYALLAREVYGDIGNIIRKHDKPLALCLLTQCQYLWDVQSRTPYPIYETPEDAVEALSVLRDFEITRASR